MPNDFLISDPLPMVPVGIKKKLLSSFSLEKGRSRYAMQRTCPLFSTVSDIKLI